MANERKLRTRLDGEIRFFFEKSQNFRVIHCDGAFGGPAPNASVGLIHMALFSERLPLPKSVVHEIQGGQIGHELLEKRDSKDGVFREVEADVIMSLATAASIRDWLTEQIRVIEDFKSMALQQAENAGAIARVAVDKAAAGAVGQSKSAIRSTARTQVVAAGKRQRTGKNGN